MTQILDPVAAGNILALVAYALPSLALLTLLLLLLGSRRTAKRDEAKPKATDGSRDELYHRSYSSDIVSHHQDMAHATSFGERRTAAEALQPGAAPSPHQGAIEDLNSRLNSAMSAGTDTELAPLYLAIARQHKSLGDCASYLTALRSAAGLASKHGPRAIHAQARLELAEAAFEIGDLTGACEQWQMAREALLEDGQKDACAAVDQTMRAHQCPTDWVLTDF